MRGLFRKRVASSPTRNRVCSLFPRIPNHASFLSSIHLPASTTHTPQSYPLPSHTHTHTPKLVDRCFPHPPFFPLIHLTSPVLSEHSPSLNQSPSSLFSHHTHTTYQTKPNPLPNPSTLTSLHHAHEQRQPHPRLHLAFPRGRRHCEPKRPRRPIARSPRPPRTCRPLPSAAHRRQGRRLDRPN